MKRISGKELMGAREFVEKNKQSFERETSAVGAQKLKSVTRVALETPETCTSIHEQRLACDESSFVPGKKRACRSYFRGLCERFHRHTCPIARLSFAASRIVSTEHFCFGRPGAMAFAVMPSAASSMAIVRVRLSNAGFYCSVT